MKFILFVLAASFFAQSASADFIPNIRYFDNKLVNAWDDIRYSDDINDLPDEGDLIVNEDKINSVNFERVARWKPAQFEYAIRAHHYLLNSGIDPKRGKFSKALGAIGLVAGYKYDVEPTYINGKYTRSDVLAMRPSFDLKGTLHQMKDFKVLGKGTPGYELEYGFYRQFSSPIKAVIAKPYFHKNLPFDAQHAVRGLKAGDIFNFKAKLNLTFGTHFVTNLLQVSSIASAGVQFMASGLFEVFVVRLPDDKVQLRIMTSRRKAIGATASIGLNNIVITNVGLADSLIGKIVGLELVNGKLEKKFNEGLIIDYVIDLKDRAAIEAYDESLLNIRKFNYMQMVDPLTNTEDYFKKLVLNIDPLETADSSAITRQFHLEHDGVTKSTGFTLGNKILQYKYSTHKSENIFEDETDDDRSYVLNSNQTTTESSFLFSLRRKQALHKATSIDVRDDGEENALGVILSSDIADKYFSAGDLKKTISKLERQLPEVSELLDFTHFQGRKLESVGVRTSIHFTKEALLLFPEIGRSAIQSAYKNYLKKYKVTDIIPRRTSHGSPVGQPDQLHAKTLQVAKLLEKLGKRETSLKEKVALMMELCELKLFKATGAGFFMSLLPRDSWKETIGIQVDINSTAGPGINYLSGPAEHIELISALTHFENIMNGDELEFRLLLQSLLKE